MASQASRKILVVGALCFGLAIALPARASTNVVEYDFNAMLQPIPATAKYADPDFNIWCGSAVKGDDGKYHMFYSRWPRKFGHHAWVTHSEVAHAVSDSPFGPWKHLEVALPARGTNFWDGSCTHNPTVLRIGNKFYLYYMGNYGNGVAEKPLNWTHRNRQRIGVAVADSPDGPWLRFDRPVLDISSETNAPDALITSNPSVALRPDGGVLMIYKAVGMKRPLPFGGPVVHLVATSDSPTGPFTKLPGEVFSAKGVMFAAEDPFIWRGVDRYWAVVKDNEGNFTRRGYSLALWESADGFHWKLASHPLVATPEVKWADGRTVKLDALERPQLLFENGEPIALYCAAADRKGRDGSFNVQIPLKTLGRGAREDGSEVSVGLQSYPSYQGIQAVPLAQVRLLPSEFKLRQDLHRRVILSYNPDRLLHNFRVNAGLPSDAKPYGGWESPGVGLRGHFTGHYLSACALMYAATGDPQFKERADLLVTELAKCQDALGDGYLSAFPASQFDVLETQFFEGVWAPYYTIHKIMAGLLDAHEQTGNRQALAVAMRMAGYFGARISKLSPEAVEKMTRTDYKGNPVNEYGGIAESLLALNRITGVPEYLKLARVFMRDWFIEPLAAGEDRLEGLHANTHVPQATSFALAGPLTGDERLRKAAHNFWRQVTERHSFALGGNAFDEKFKAPGVEAEFLTDLSAETCNTHNMLKLTRALFEQEPDCAYADYFEHALYNHILASIAPDTGNTTYHLSVKPGHFKVYGTHDQSMWCCTGSGIENTARYAEAAYFIGTNTIWVNLYIPSSLELPEQGMKLVQESRFPADDKITFKLSCKQPVKLQINLRLPGWLAAPAAIRISGIGLQANEIPAPGHYLTIAREWRDGDTVELRLPMALRTRPAMDHAQVVSFFYGPVLLAGGLGTRDMPPSDAAIRQTEFHNLPVPLVPRLASTTTSALTPVPGKPLHFTAKIDGEPGERSTQSFVPFYEMHHQRYSIYWRSK